MSRMVAQQRQFPRYRAEVMVDFGTSELRIAGMTWNVSQGGMFIRTTKVPEVGEKLLVNLRLAEGRQLLIQGEVVRVFHPSALASGSPAGVAVAIKNGDGYKRFSQSVARASKASA
ncbi:MAG: PilZ domain-containing protein [Thermoanaerobaculia bacterium]